LAFGGVLSSLLVEDDLVSMSSSRTKRRRVRKMNHSQEQIIDLVSSSDNSPELVSTSRNLSASGLPHTIQTSASPTQPTCRPRRALCEATTPHHSRSRRCYQAESMESATSRHAGQAAEELAPSTQRGREWSLADWERELDPVSNLVQIDNLVHLDWNNNNNNMEQTRSSTVSHYPPQPSSAASLSREDNRRLQTSANIQCHSSNQGRTSSRRENTTLVAPTTVQSSSSTTTTTSGRAYATTRNPRMNIQRRILEAGRGSLHNESGPRYSTRLNSRSLHNTLATTRRNRGRNHRNTTSNNNNNSVDGNNSYPSGGDFWIGGGSSSSSRHSLNAWIDYVAQVNPWLLLSFHDGDFTADDYSLLLQLDERVENRKGASKPMIESLPCFKVTETEKGESCCICLDEYIVGESLRKLPCNHIFHKDCIERWLLENACCPIDKERMDGDFATTRTEK